MRVQSLGHVVLKVRSIERSEVADRAFTKSIHLLDPDGNEVELYIDTSDAWKTDAPLSLPPMATR